MRQKIYLDYSSTTPLDPFVLKAMMPFLKNKFGNPSSSHYFGQQTHSEIEKSRETISKFLNCSPLEIIFTSGATEANNLAIRGIVDYFLFKKDQQKQEKKDDKRFQIPHIIVSQVEHNSVLEVCKELESRELIELSFVKVDSQGVLEINDLTEKIKENTILVSVMYVNSEIGTIQPISEIGKILKEFNKNRKTKILFHTDAAQAAQFLNCDVQKLGVDLLTLSSHKIYGPKGIGVLYKKDAVSLKPLIIGAGQEWGLRAGTENVAGIVGMGKAIELILDPRFELTKIKIRQLRDKLITGILRNINGVELVGSKDKRVQNNANFCFKGVEARDLVFALDQKGIAVSAGSACSDKAQRPSPVIIALGKSENEAKSCVRISIGKYTKKEDIEKTIKIIKFVYNSLILK